MNSEEIKRHVVQNQAMFLNTNDWLAEIAYHVAKIQEHLCVPKQKVAEYVNADKLVLTMRRNDINGTCYLAPTNQYYFICECGYCTPTTEDYLHSISQWVNHVVQEILWGKVEGGTNKNIR